MSKRPGAVMPDAYERWRAGALVRTTELLGISVILDLAGDLRGRRVLDVGTGDGTYAIEAALRGGEVTAVDVSEEMLAAAQRRARERGVMIDFRPARAEAVPFADGAFDVVLSVTVLCFLRDARRP